MIRDFQVVTAHYSTNRHYSSPVHVTVAGTVIEPFAVPKIILLMKDLQNRSVNSRFYR
jgi:hypothetical protein